MYMWRSGKLEGVGSLRHAGLGIKLRSVVQEASDRTAASFLQLLHSFSPSTREPRQMGLFSLRPSWST